MTISIIVATSKEGIIAVDDKIPWKCSSDLKYFRETTLDSIVIMGRKTWDSIGNKCLNNRINVVISKNIQDIYIDENSVIPYRANSIESACEIANKLYYLNLDTFIIGGETIYNQFLQKKIVDKIYLSVISDTLIPEYNKHSDIKRFSFKNYSKWKEIETINYEEFKLSIFDKII